MSLEIHFHGYFFFNFFSDSIKKNCYLVLCRKYYKKVSFSSRTVNFGDGIISPNCSKISTIQNENKNILKKIKSHDILNLFSKNKNELE